MTVYEEAKMEYINTSAATCDCIMDGGDCNQCGGAWGH